MPNLALPQQDSWMVMMDAASGAKSENRCDYRWRIVEGVSHCCALPSGHLNHQHVCLCRATLHEVHAHPA